MPPPDGLTARRPGPGQTRARSTQDTTPTHLPMVPQHLCLSSPLFLNCLPLTASRQALNKNMKGKTIKRLEENVGKYLCDLGQGRIP